MYQATVLRLTYPVFAVMFVFIIILSGCVDNNKFDVSTSKLTDLRIGTEYTLTCHVPKDTSVNNYKLMEFGKRGYEISGLYLANDLGKTEIYVYKLTSIMKGLNYLFEGKNDAYKAEALEEWNKKQLANRGYTRNIHTDKSRYLKEINGVKTDRLVRTTAEDREGNKMIAESCWFDYPNGFLFIMSSWPEDYYDAWQSHDFIFKYK